jgi:uncharacterized protein (DUF983 family)
METTPPDAATLKCPECGKDGMLRPSQSLTTGRMVDRCALCGHDNLYIQKDFNRALGISIVVIGVMLSLVLFAQSNAFYAMLALIGTAVVDAIIYFIVGEVTVCYACHTIYRGFDPNPDHAPFNLEFLERYGGQAPRR